MTVIVARVKDKKGLEKFIENTKYEEVGLARIGYNMKTADALGLKEVNKEDYYIYIKVPDEQVDVVKEQIKDYVEFLEGEEKEKVVKAFTDLESAAEEGFGALFS